MWNNLFKDRWKETFISLFTEPVEAFDNLVDSTPDNLVDTAGNQLVTGSM